MNNILLDMNYPIFQEQLFALEKLEQRAFLNVLRKIKKLNWDELYKDNGLKWQLISSKKTSKGHNLYSFRFSQKYRATGFRDNDYLVILGLFPDHDGAYK